LSIGVLDGFTVVKLVNPDELVLVPVVTIPVVPVPVVVPVTPGVDGKPVPGLVGITGVVGVVGVVPGGVGVGVAGTPPKPENDPRFMEANWLLIDIADMLADMELSKLAMLA